MERIHKENWEDYYIDESILGVEMRDGNKYYLLPNGDGFVPVNLKRHRDYDYSDTNNLEVGFDNIEELEGNKKVFKFDSMQEMEAWATS